ncbi:MAG: hypothetical protein ACI9UA_000342 [Pseudoalteromonas tetraodonis]|jgi:hypothetical protein
MIASEYLDYRERLDATMGSLADAARRSGAKVGQPGLLRHLVGALKDPFLLVVAGESGAGKSVFLNALAGEEFCDPVEGAVAYFKFGEYPRDVPAGDGLMELYRPSTFLKNFHIVEFPGTSVAIEGAAAVAERFVPMADLVLAVISVADAWTPGVWKSLDRVQLGHGKEALVVLSGCDLRTPDEINAVVEHMQLTMGKRYGEALPIFQMSAENAFLARTNPAGGGEVKLAVSGILEFEQFVSDQLLASDFRMGKFDKVIMAARTIVDGLRVPFSETEEILGRDGDLLEGLKQEINARYEKTNGTIRDDFFKGLDDGHAAAVAAAQVEVVEVSGWGSLPAQVFGGGKLPEGLGKRFRESVAAATEQQVVEAMTTAEGDIGDLWQTLSERVGEVFVHQLSARDSSGKAVWSGRGENLLRRADACAEKASVDFSIEAAVAETQRHGALSLRFFAISALVFAIGGGVLFALGYTPFHLIVGGLAIVAFGFGTGQFIDGRKKLKKALADRAAAGRIQLRADLSNELTSHVHEYYTKLGSIFDPVQELCLRQVEEVTPQITAVRELDGKVSRLAEELVGLRAAAKKALREA